ncbi:hypothetical protein ACFY36_13030 [Actinoplanes sp. NPDC000266]
MTNLAEIVHVSFSDDPSWLVAIQFRFTEGFLQVAANPADDTGEDRLLLAGHGDCDVIMAGRARATAAVVLSRALGIERAEAFGRLGELPATAAAGLTEDQAQALVRLPTSELTTSRSRRGSEIGTGTDVLARDGF